MLMTAMREYGKVSFETLHNFNRGCVCVGGEECIADLVVITLEIVDYGRRGRFLYLL